MRQGLQRSCLATIGGRYRDKIRIYADTPEANSPRTVKLIKYRTETQGFTWAKQMDVGIEEIAEIPGRWVNPEKFGKFAWGSQYGETWTTNVLWKCPSTRSPQIQKITREKD